MKLLDVQELDSRLDTLEHQRRSLPEIAQIEALLAERTEVDNRVRDLKVLVDDLTREQKKADSDVEQVKARRERDQKMLDTGAVSNPKDVEHMMSELESLQRRIGDLEDVEIDVMERLEEAQGELDAKSAELAEINGRGKALVTSRDSQLTELEAQSGEAKAERDFVAAGVPEDLLGLYQKLRDQKGGVGAALLRARECGGCRLTLDASILRDIAATPEDEVVRCEECSRILVRTEESGL